MKTAIIGSRGILEFDFDAISRHLPEGTDTVVSGGAAGVDSIAERFAKAMGLSFVRIEPDYARYGKNAPLVRNEKIVGHADFVLAIWDFQSRGTAHIIAKCVWAGVPVKIIPAVGGTK